jgi:plasmid stabilization system protein ParE
MEGRKIIWSKLSIEKLEEILDFYEIRNGNNNYSKKLYSKIVRDVNLLKLSAKIGVQTDEENIRGLIITDYIVFYEITQKTIVILTIWDCQQNPKNRSY